MMKMRTGSLILQLKEGESAEVLDASLRTRPLQALRWEKVMVEGEKGANLFMLRSGVKSLAASATGCR